jgi:aminoglycoside phosphotransferase (APT) family kinase protein
VPILPQSRTTGRRPPWHDQHVTCAGQPDSDTLRRLLRAVEPDLTLVAAQALTGGVSAQVTRIDALRPDGTTDRLVLRQYGAANLRSDPLTASHEYQLLTLLRAAQLPVPRPRYVDESRAILPVPLLVTEFLEGIAVTGPAQLTGPRGALTSQLAAALASIHQAGISASDIPHLTDIRGIATTTIGTWPTSLDDALGEAAVRAALTRVWPPPLLNKPVLLHGDYWPGNTLWRDGTLVAVIDWEDAVLGDPVADVANTRMELTMLFSTAAATDFTRQYDELMPSLDRTALPHWDLYAALRHAGRMTQWGLTPADLARLQAGHREFTAAALARLPSRATSVQNDLVPDVDGRSALDRREDESAP